MATGSGLFGVVTCSAALLAGPALAAEPEKEAPLTIESLPAPVQKTARDLSRGATVRSVARELDEEGKTVYELSLKVDGRGRDVIIGADGAVQVVEQELTLDALPGPVRAAVVKAAGKGKIDLVESVTKGGTLAYYEARVAKGKDVSEVRVRPDGQVMPEDKKK